jgi:hypothetical protein
LGGALTLAAPANAKTSLSTTRHCQFITQNDTMMVETRFHLFVGLSFVAGVLLTLGFKDVYPDLERRFRSRRRRFSTALGKANVKLTDNTTNHPDGALIPVGIEGCIGNTPLFKIRSLSEATGCEILAKAEFLNGAGNSPKDRVALSIITAVPLSSHEVLRLLLTVITGRR